MRRPAAACALVLAAWLALPPRPASAQEGIFGGLKKSLDSTFSSVTTTIKDSSGAVTRTTTKNVFPRLDLSLDTLIYPSLRLNAGGVFEVNLSSSDTNGSETDSTISRIRPFFLLRGTNPLLSPGVGYFRRVARASAQGGPGVKLVSEDYAAYLGWQPAGGPQSEFQFIRTNTFDGKRALQDEAKDFGSLVSVYTYRGLGAYYQGSYLNTNDRLRNFETRQVSNAGRVDLSGTFIDKRLLWSTTYNLNNQVLTTAGTGQKGEVALPVIPFAALSVLSDTPVTAVLTQNPLLVDGNLTASAGLNLGLPGLGADPQARNIGLDFLNATEVNRLRVWIDRELPVEVARSFTWEIYSSPDNLIWRRETVVSTAPFGPFENRFEVDFPGITARYLKVVTRPLSAVVPDAARFPDIFVTELQAFLRRPAGEGRDRLERTNHISNTDVRLRILNVPLLYYEGFYLYNRLDPTGTKRDTLSNGLSVNHTFGRMFSVYGRGAREQGVQPEGRRVATLQNATFTVEPIQTFRSTLLYTAQDERIGETLNDRKGVVIQNNAQLYRGVDLLFGFGWNFTTRETGETVHDRLLNASATVVPRQHVSLTFSYDDTTSKRSGTFTGLPEYHTRRGYLTLAVDPIRTLHLVLTEELLTVTGEPKRTAHNIGANWAPFPDGALQFIFAYDEALRPLYIGRERSVLGSVRWYLSRRSYVDVTYQRTKSEFVFQTTESKILSSDVRLFF